jgi:hypothetical protein
MIPIERQTLNDIANGAAHLHAVEQTNHIPLRDKQALYREIRHSYEQGFIAGFVYKITGETK